MGRARRESGRAARAGALAARGLPQRARECRVRGGLPRPQEPLVHRRQCRAHPDQRLGRCLDVGAQRLCCRRAQHRRRGGGGRLRAHAPAAARGEGRRTQLPGHVERGRLAAGVDAADGSHRHPRRLRRPRLQRRSAAGGVDRRRRGLAARLCRRRQGRPLRAGRRLPHRGRGRPGPERRLRQLLQALRLGGRQPDRGRGGDGGRRRAHRQRLHQSRPVLGLEGRWRRQPGRGHAAHLAYPRTAEVLRRRVRRGEGQFRRGVPAADRALRRLLSRRAVQSDVGRAGQVLRQQRLRGRDDLPGHRSRSGGSGLAAFHLLDCGTGRRFHHRRGADVLHGAGAISVGCRIPQEERAADRAGRRPSRRAGGQRVLAHQPGRVRLVPARL